MIRRFLLCWLLLSSLDVALAATYRGEETLWQDTTWSGEILVDGIVTVAPGVTLEISPGTTVRFTRFDSNSDGIGEHELFIQGRLLARGTAEQPVLFTSAEPEPQQADWGAVNMMASEEESVMRHCRVEYGYRGFHAHFAIARLENSVYRANRRGAQFQESTVGISDCRFTDNLNGLQFRDSTVTLSGIHVSGSHWGIRGVYSTVTLADSVIEHNRINGVNFRDSEVTVRNTDIRNNRRGLYLQRSQGELQNLRLTGNREHGLFLEDSDGSLTGSLIAGNGRAGIRILSSGTGITGNIIIDNDEYAVINDGPTDIELHGNWWGTADPDELSAIMRDRNDRPGSGTVRVSPLAEPPGQFSTTGNTE